MAVAQTGAGPIANGRRSGATPRPCRASTSMAWIRGPRSAGRAAQASAGPRVVPGSGGSRSNHRPRVRCGRRAHRARVRVDPPEHPLRVPARAVHLSGPAGPPRRADVRPPGAWVVAPGPAVRVRGADVRIRDDRGGADRGSTVRPRTPARPAVLPVGPAVPAGLPGAVPGIRLPAAPVRGAGGSEGGRDGRTVGTRKRKLGPGGRQAWKPESGMLAPIPAGEASASAPAL